MQIQTNAKSDEQKSTDVMLNDCKVKLMWSQTNGHSNKCKVKQMQIQMNAMSNKQEDKSTGSPFQIISVSNNPIYVSKDVEKINF